MLVNEGQHVIPPIKKQKLNLFLGYSPYDWIRIVGLTIISFYIFKLFVSDTLNIAKYSLVVFVFMMMLLHVHPDYGESIWGILKKIVKYHIFQHKHFIHKER
ncbi:hypothetical protein G7059_03675 [Erysipelothrix sp. HDW6A]|uniref:hypothetical protein n=1 Tax=Erysipelothrix sp. HDW6A TaxID=2714928 RepID=UPI00140A2FCE|nr:hypothetical protein [Erysipelothrix sp. HDW6A]QIK57011.1 hypothetical protein G7059_03675 [Erysipelothrix sp. HDW6A]